MFAPTGYCDLFGVISALNQEAERRLHFPSLADVEVEHLGWLAWAYGELDFIEKEVFKVASKAGLYACSAEGLVMKLSENPLRFSAMSAVDMLDDSHFEIAIAESIARNASSRKDEKYEAGVDPWAVSRGGSYRSVPMCFSRSGYLISLRNFDAYVQWLREAGYSQLSKVPFLSVGFEGGWRNLEGRSLCIEVSTLSEIKSETFWRNVQLSIYSAVWDNAQEMFSELLESTGGPNRITGKVNVETRALAIGERLLASGEYSFRNLEKLRADIGIDELGERAWRRVIEKLRPQFPFISVPGRKS